LDNEGVSDSCLESHVLVEEVVLVSKVSSDDFFAHPDMGQRLTTLFEDNFELL
jgi:hypothetical protein